MKKLFANKAALVFCAVAVAGCASKVDTPTRNTSSLTANASGPVSKARYTLDAGAPMQAFVTGYSYWDNTPRGSAAIARPVIHRQAGGTGTFRDPVTVAVGHVKFGERSKMDYPAGTRFYFPNLQKYGIVEDLCGDGARPQNGPCHSGHNGLTWLDIYVGGRSVGAAASNRCMNSITGVQNVMINPAPNLPVRPGEISLSNCQGT